MARAGLLPGAAFGRCRATLCFLAHAGLPGAFLLPRLLPFPKGRSQLENYLRELDAKGIDWRASAQHGSIALTPDAPELPAGTEVALLQFLIALDTNLQLVPTSLVESVRLLIFKSANGIVRSQHQPGERRECRQVHPQATPRAGGGRDAPRRSAPRAGRSSRLSRALRERSGPRLGIARPVLPTDGRLACSPKTGPPEMGVPR